MEGRFSQIQSHTLAVKSLRHNNTMVWDTKHLKYGFSGIEIV